MHDARFFESTRGKIVAALRRRHAASAVDLAREFGVSPNAIRQQLLLLERDGFVVERAVKRGATKPTLEYSLTPRADELFPQRYDRMLNAVLRELRETYGDDAVQAILDKVGERAASRMVSRLRSEDAAGRVEEIAELLRENGVETEVVERDGAVELREHNCPYANTVTEHPEVCSMIRHVLRKATNEGEGDGSNGSVLQLESLATGGGACRFEIPHLSGG